MEDTEVWEEALARTIEYNNYGLNAATLGAFGTIVFTCWQFWSLTHQARHIKTGEAVSVGWHIYFAADFASFFWYGVYSVSITMTFNALLGIGHLLVLLQLYRCKQFRWWERLLLPTLLIFPLLMYLSRTHEIDMGFVLITERQLLFFCFSCGTLIALALQPLEMCWKKSRGDVSFHLLFTYTVAAVFWILYSFVATQDVVLQFLTSVSAILLGVSFILYFVYKPTEAKNI